MVRHMRVHLKDPDHTASGKSKAAKERVWYISESVAGIGHTQAASFSLGFLWSTQQPEWSRFMELPLANLQPQHPN